MVSKCHRSGLMETLLVDFLHGLKTVRSLSYFDKTAEVQSF